MADDKKVMDLTIEEFNKSVTDHVAGEMFQAYFDDRVRDLFKKELESERENFWIPAERHYLDHKAIEVCTSKRDEWEKNHEFMSGMRKNGTRAGWIMASVILVAITGSVIMIMKLGFKAALSLVMRG
jgi:hypothetical protein